MTSTTDRLPAPPTVSPSASASVAGSAVRDIAALSPGVVAFGLMLGVTVVTLHAGAGAAVLGAVLVFGGSAQLTTVTVLHLGAGLLAAVVSGMVVNARVMLYGAALEPWFRDQPLWFRLLAPHFIQDQTYLAAIGHRELGGREFRRYWGWAGLTLLVVWTASVAAGLLVGPALPPLPHLALVGTALFVWMLVAKLVDRTALVAAVTAGAAALAVAHVVPQLGILGGTGVGVLAALLVGERTRSTR
jgi:predicted branched-subunit amino acid permease